MRKISEKGKVKFMKKSMALCILAGLISHASASASKSFDDYILDDVLVTAMRTERSDLETPASTVIITAKDLAEGGENSLFETVSRVIGINFKSYGTGGESYIGHSPRINVRGLDKGTLVLLNGAPMNMLTYNSMISSIPVEAVERLEIVKGANSVLYGAEAMAGVINIITKDKHSAKTSIGSELGNKLANVSFTTGTKDFTVRYQRQWRQGQDPFNQITKSGKAKTWSCSTKDKSYKNDVFLNYQLNDKLSMNYFYNNVHGKFTTWENKDRAKLENKIRIPKKEYQQNSEQQNIDFIYDDPQNEVKAIFTYLKDKFNMPKYDYKEKKQVWVYNETVNKKSQGYSFDVQKGFQIDDVRHLVGGFSWHKEIYDQYTKDNHLKRDSYAVFMSYTQDFTKQLAADLGVRAHFVKANKYEKKQNVFLPQLRLNYRVDKSNSYYLNIGKGFEMPSLTSPFNSKSTLSETLKPQEGYTYEIGLKHLAQSEGWKIALFAMNIKNKFEWVKENTINPNGDPNTNILINKSKFKNAGIEVEYNKMLGTDWQMKYSISLSNPKAEDKNSKWEQADAKFQTGIDFTYHRNKLSGNVNCFFIGKREAAFYRHDGGYASAKGVDHNIPNSLQMNLTVHYHATPLDNISFGVYNILDKYNYVSATEYYALPRNIRIGYTHTF